ncbi:ubiquitin--protein ligase [Teladorsagia circumcincta]|uniref:Ubiquitin--protein ligase n=1 Tax=Teladorsagia circumcincta TaxID=45464 RepID=A0A2G9U5H4_TELCI|nr:ubiquitin--protein ligase [Teladorsagia circumcincta]
MQVFIATFLLDVNTIYSTYLALYPPGRRGEHGVIASGRVIPNDVNPSQPSSSSQSDVNVPSAQMALSPPRTSPRPPTPVAVRRVLRRKVGVMLPTRMLKPAGIGREDRPAVVSRLLKEARTIRSEAPAGCHVSPKRDDIFQWVAVLEGPADTVYDGGTFFCNIHFSMNYPTIPPKVCIDILNEKWKPTMNTRTVMMALMSLMYSCNPDEALVASIAKQYRENRADFDKMARIWTSRYAT